MEIFINISLVGVIIALFLLFGQLASQSGNVYILIAIILTLFFLLILKKSLHESSLEDSIDKRIDISIDVQKLKHDIILPIKSEFNKVLEDLKKMQ